MCGLEQKETNIGGAWLVGTSRRRSQKGGVSDFGLIPALAKGRQLRSTRNLFPYHREAPGFED